MQVSVIIPSYNHMSFIGRAIESVLEQTFADWELIIVDDCSRDDTAKIVAGYVDPRIRFSVNEVNLGTYGNLNRGLDLAQGDWIAILDSDDFWLPTKLEKQSSALSQVDGATYCYTDGLKVDPFGEPLGEPSYLMDYPREVAPDALPFILGRDRVIASSLMFRNGIIRFDRALRYCGDWHLLLRLAAGGRAACVNEPLTAFRIHPTNTTNNLGPMLREEMAIREAILADESRWFVDFSGSAAVREGLSVCAMHLGALYLLFGNIKAMREVWKRGLRLYPGNRTLHKRLWAHYLSRDMLGYLWPGTDVAALRKSVSDCKTVSVSFE